MTNVNQPNPNNIAVFFRLPYDKDVQIDDLDLNCDGFNAETREALDEYEAMKNHPERYRRYSSFSELVMDVDKNTIDSK